MYSVLRPLLFSLPAEIAHGLGAGSARLIQAVNPRLLAPLYAFEDPMLRQYQWGIEFRNPVGLAAGMDKNGHLIPFWAALGFGSAEIGSVSARPSRGNPKPRTFRLERDRALINRMGLNNHGAEAVARRLERAGRTSIPLGINVAKTHDPSIVDAAGIDDVVDSVRRLLRFGDYLAINVSCPNTAEGKTFEDPNILDQLLGAVLEVRREQNTRTPILIKLSPPIFERIAFDSLIEEIIALSIGHGIDGFIVCNTTVDRTGLQTPADQLARLGEGGLSGRPLEERSTRMVRYVYDKSGGSLPIVGVGGVFDAASAYRKILAGACLIQLYTGLVYEGPSLVKRIKTGLVELLKRDGFRNIREAIGAERHIDPTPAVPALQEVVA